MLAELKKVRFPVETGLLLAFCIFLPLLEFWKNLALLAYFITWTVNRVRTRDLGGPWRTSDTLVVLWIGAVYLAAAFAGLPGHAWAKTGDVAISALLFWLVTRAGYAAREVQWMLGALVVSTLAGLAHGYWRIWNLEVEFSRLELNSVGHVNHSAVYVAMMLGVCASWFFARGRNWGAVRRDAAFAAVAFVLASLVVTESRAAIAVGFLLLMVLAAAWWRRWRAPLIASGIGLVAIAALMIGFGAGVIQKQAEFAASHNVLSYRDGIWRTGIAAWEKYPWFGVGKDNYSRISLELIRSSREEAGRDFDPNRYVRASHAHSLYITTLAERGAVGFAALAAVLVAALAALLRFRPRPEDADFAWLAWGGAASAWIVTAGIGVFNTTLHHEHGLLAALLLGLWLSTLERRAS